MPFELAFEFQGKRYKSAEKGLKALSKQLKRTLDAKTFDPIVKRNVRTMLTTVVQAMELRHSTAWAPFSRLPSGAGGGRLAKRSGSLLDSIRKSVSVDGNLSSGGIRASIGGSAIARVHEEGAVIKARNVQYLAIPLPAALNPDGTPIHPGPRDWAKTFVQRSKKGNLIIFQRRGPEIIPLYVLKKSVKIPARLGLGATLETAVDPLVDRIMDDALKALTQGSKT